MKIHQLHWQILTAAAAILILSLPIGTLENVNKRAQVGLPVWALCLQLCSFFRVLNSPYVWHPRTIDFTPTVTVAFKINFMIFIWPLFKWQCSLQLAI